MNNLLIIEKYEEFVNYVYPVVQNIDRKHGYVKQKFIDTIFQQVDMFYKAKRKIKKYKLNNDFEQLEKFLGSWTGHIKTCDSANLKFYIKKEYDLWNNKQLA